MRFSFYIGFLILPFTLFTQENKSYCLNPDFEKEITSLIEFSVPVMSISELADNRDGYYILDAREKEEYEISHIPAAIHVGYEDFTWNALSGISKNSPVVVYCSVGYRSEKIGEKLKQNGFTKVYNLFGSIFEWVNQDNEVVDTAGNVTNRIHTYNRKWSRWVEQKNAEITW